MERNIATGSYWLAMTALGAAVGFGSGFQSPEMFTVVMGMFVSSYVEVRVGEQDDE